MNFGSFAVLTFTILYFSRIITVSTSKGFSEDVEEFCEIQAMFFQSENIIELRLPCAPHDLKDFDEQLQKRARFQKLYSGIETIQWDGTFTPSNKNFYFSLMANPKSVKVLIIEGFILPEIRHDEFLPFQKLKELTLHKNVIKRIDISLFNLNSLNIIHNQVKEILTTHTRSQFEKSLQELVITEPELDLNHTLDLTQWKQLKKLSITCKFFNSTQLETLSPRLQELDLRHLKPIDQNELYFNRFPELLKLTVNNVRGLKAITIGYNVSKLENVEITDNFLERIQFNSTQEQLKVINVARNHLKNLNWVKELLKVQEIDASFNYLSGDVEIPVISKYLHVLNLRHNRVKKIICKNECEKIFFKIYIAETTLSCEWLQNINETSLLSKLDVTSSSHNNETDFPCVNYTKEADNGTFSYSHLYFSKLKVSESLTLNFYQFLSIIVIFCALPTTICVLLLTNYIYERYKYGKQKPVPFYRTLTDFIRPQTKDNYLEMRNLPSLGYEAPISMKTESVTVSDTTTATLYEEIPDRAQLDENPLPNISLQIKDKNFMETLISELYELNTSRNETKQIDNGDEQEDLEI